MKTNYLCAILFVVASTLVNGADVVRVPSSSIEMKFDFGSVVLIKGKDGMLASVRVIWADKEVIVPLAELEDVDSPVLQSARVVSTLHNKRLKSAKDLGNADFLIVSLEYGKMKDVPVGTKDTDGPLKLDRVRNRVYFIFPSVGYSHRDRRIATKGEAKWMLFTKDPGEKEYSDGPEIMEFPDTIAGSPPSLPVKN